MHLRGTWDTEWQIRVGARLATAEPPAQSPSVVDKTRSARERSGGRSDPHPVPPPPHPAAGGTTCRALEVLSSPLLGVSQKAEASMVVVRGPGRSFLHRGACQTKTWGVPRVLFRWPGSGGGEPPGESLPRGSCPRWPMAGAHHQVALSGGTPGAQPQMMLRSAF